MKRKSEELENEITEEVIEHEDTVHEDEVTGDATSIPVSGGDKVTITVSAAEAKLINEVKDIKAGKFRKNETEDIVDIIDNTLSLQVPAVDGTVTTVEIPEDADAVDDITLGVSADVVADIVTLVGEN